MGNAYTNRRGGPRRPKVCKSLKDRWTRWPAIIWCNIAWTIFDPMGPGSTFGGTIGLSRKLSSNLYLGGGQDNEGTNFFIAVAFPLSPNPNILSVNFVGGTIVPASLHGKGQGWSARIPFTTAPANVYHGTDLVGTYELLSEAAP